MAIPLDKTTRKELQRRADPRPWSSNDAFSAKPWPMPGAPYLVAHACFKCRRSVKIDVGHWPPRRARCPECAGKLCWLGRTFRAPKRSDVKQWKKVEVLRKAGFLFHSYDAGPYPDTLQDAKAFIVERRAALIPKRS